MPSKSKELTCALLFAIATTGCTRNPDQTFSLNFDPSQSRCTLKIENHSSEMMWIDTEELAKKQFKWEIYDGRKLVGSSSNTVTIPKTSSPTAETEIADHFGAVDISPGRAITVDLSNYHPELAHRNTFTNGKVLLWYCQTWDSKSLKWLQGCGRVNLTAINQLKQNQGN